MKESVCITWHGHSCFEIEADTYKIVLDPYEDGSVNGCAPLKLEADAVLCSHSHGDHGAIHVVKQRVSTVPCPFEITRLKSYHDDVQGAKRGPNVIHILSYKGIRVAHFGDIGCRLSDEEIKTIGALDAAMIPVGGFFTIDGKEAASLAERLQANIVIPMHYRSDTFGFGVLSTLEDFLTACDLPSEAVGASIEISKNMEKKVLIPAYEG